MARVYQEVAYLGQHVHWTLSELMSLDHRERLRWVQEVSSLAEAAEDTEEMLGRRI